MAQRGETPWFSGRVIAALAHTRHDGDDGFPDDRARVRGQCTGRGGQITRRRRRQDSPRLGWLGLASSKGELVHVPGLQNCTSLNDNLNTMTICCD